MGLPDEVPFELKDLVKIGKPLTGHIDILQVRYGLIHVLDFKPDAHKEKRSKVISQLFCYALALSVRTGVWLRNFKCAWFDENNYYEFSPGDIVVSYLKEKGINCLPVTKKYMLNKPAQRYFTSELFNKVRKSQ